MNTKTSGNRPIPILIFALVLLLPHLGQCYYNPATGKWLSRDPLGEAGGVNRYGFVNNRPTDGLDVLGLRIYVMAPSSDLDSSGFAEKVLAALQSVIGDCARLNKTPIIKDVETGFLLWKKTVPTLIGWEIQFADAKANCVCNACWKHLRPALGDNLPRKDIEIFRGESSFYLDNAKETQGSDGVSRVGIYEGINAAEPQIDEQGTVQWGQTSFESVLWHEAVGHGYLGLHHPTDPSNYAGRQGKDPTIEEENLARSCLRLQGAKIRDRAPTYYGWQHRPAN